jgi:endonuclease/exonuclease/phosphatase (EEP) superfamily protein YafD
VQQARERTAVKRLLAVVGSIAIAASLVPLAARLSWVFELFTHFRVQLVVGLIVLGLVFGVRRAYVWCGALAACAAVNAAPLMPYLGPGDPDGRAPTLTVLVANVRAVNTEHAGLLASIAAENPDVVLIVEFTPAWDERLTPLAARYPHRFTMARRDAFGIALYSRHPLEEAHDAALGATATIDARVLAPRGTVRLIGVHLRPPMSPRSARERDTELTALAQHVANIAEPRVVLGDFNMTPYSPYFADFLEITGLRDPRAQFGLGFTWPTFFPVLGIPIDHCLVSPDLGVAQYRRLPGFGSDHYPVVAQLVQD